MIQTPTMNATATIATNADENTTRAGAHAFFPAAINARSIGSLRSATPVAA